MAVQACRCAPLGRPRWHRQQALRLETQTIKHRLLGTLMRVEILGERYMPGTSQAKLRGARLSGLSKQAVR